MAKAALEAMNGFNLYGEKGANWSVVYVDVVGERLIFVRRNRRMSEILGCT